jgi:hypothetical protein
LVWGDAAAKVRLEWGTHHSLKPTEGLMDTCFPIQGNGRVGWTGHADRGVVDPRGYLRHIVL